MVTAEDGSQGQDAQEDDSSGVSSTDDSSSDSSSEQQAVDDPSRHIPGLVWQNKRRWCIVLVELRGQLLVVV